MKRKTVQKESKSLKTFYLYAVLVFTVIAISLFIKLIFVVQSSKYDGKHHFTLAVTKEQRVKQVIAFSPQVPALAVLTVKDQNIPYTSLAENHGIAADAQLEIRNTVSFDQDVTTTLWNATRNWNAIGTNATIIDFIRLTLLSREIISNNKVIRDITLSEKNPENNTIIARALNDPTVSSENVSIQIINASNISGAGQRLGRILTNMGANVVEVSTSHTPQAKSQLQYYGEQSYTREQIEKYLNFPASELTRQPIADIVIILGEDTRNTKKF
ncbi:MAG: LytR C-terminal domain-containing protein [Candidatus Levybacteria bacterium]|nr:LytR C-terminal domain-containing protein [Candidatus Levybacteria bacterium]